MIPSPQLRLDRKEVERVIKHFLDTGHQFHSAPDNDPELARTERRYARWVSGVREALSRCFTTNDIAHGFSDYELIGEGAVTSESDRQYRLNGDYGYKLEYLKRLKGTLAIYEVQQTEPPSSVSGKYTDRELMERAIELSRKCVSEEGNVAPKVGAIVARDGVILGEAFRGEMAPGEHAEYTLLERKLSGETLAGATLCSAPLK